MAVRALCLCDGYGGFELGLKLAGVNVQTVCRVERDSYAAAVLVARMEEKNLDQAPIWDDLATFDGSKWRGRVDIVTAGFPCQPFSQAGNRKGMDDDRYIWPVIAGIIGDVQPQWVFLENVPGFVSAGLARTLADLAEMGFNAEWGVYRAAEAGACHVRKRFWLLAYAAGVGLPTFDNIGTDGQWSPFSSVESRRTVFPAGPGRWMPGHGAQPLICRSDDGATRWLVDRIHLGGNGLVPHAAALALRHLNKQQETS